MDSLYLVRTGNFLSPEFTSPQVCIPSNAHARYDESFGTTTNKKTNIKNLKKPYSRECCAIFLHCTTQKPTHFSLSNDMQQPQIHKKSPKVPLWSSRFHFFFLVSLEGHPPPKMVTWSFLGPSKWRNSKRENDHVTIFCFFRGAHVNAVIAVYTYT